VTEFPTRLTAKSWQWNKFLAFSAGVRKTARDRKLEILNVEAEKLDVSLTRKEKRYVELLIIDARAPFLFGNFNTTYIGSIRKAWLVGSRWK